MNVNELRERVRPEKRLMDCVRSEINEKGSVIRGFTEPTPSNMG